MFSLMGTCHLKKLDKGRQHEVRHKIEIGINAIFHWIQIGIKIDVTPVRLDTQKNTPPDPKEKEEIMTINNTNSQLKELYELPIEQKKLPFDLPEPITTKDIEEKSPTPKK